MPSTLRLIVCAGGIYASFLSWALVQERLSTTPYYASSTEGEAPRYFRHVIFLNTVQSTFSALAALAYIAARRTRPWKQALGLQHQQQPSAAASQKANGHAAATSRTAPDYDARRMLARCFQCALMASIGSPFGYAALRYIDYPTQILGKSCKLVPVMLMNIVLYRRKFALHKYVVVSTVTLGISLFMLYAPATSGKGNGKGKGAASNSLLGIALLLVNLMVDGAINSTQDEVFVRYRISGSQMMLFMNAFATAITTTSMLIPLPSIPIVNPSLPGAGRHSELANALAFIRSHPAVLKDILLFSGAGAIGQLFIFDTLEQFGSLALVTITVTRKLFTMLLSLVVYNHCLSLGQWVGVITVFAGIGIEALVKRQESKEKQRRKKLLKAEKDGDGPAGLAVPNGSGAHSAAGKDGHASGAVTPVRMKDI